MKIRFFITVIICLLFARAALAGDGFSGKVVRVADGDTITVLAPGNRQVKVRLYGIDCPERKQAFGSRARQFTADRVAGQTVVVERMDTDRYGRTVGIVRSNDGGILNEELLSNGFAWVYPQYCKARFCPGWKQREMQARQKGLGLWRDRAPVEPWNFRKMNRR